MIWSIEKRFPGCSKEEFLRRVRGADFLFTLIAEAHSRHHQNEPSHSQGLTGGRQLGSAWQDLKSGHLLLSKFTTTADSASRYFMNDRGGLGQYYLGTLIELDLLGLDEGMKPPFVGYTKDVGQKLAEAVNKGVPSDEFWRCVESDLVTLEDLDVLAPFCACAIVSNPPESEILDSLFRAEGPWTKDVGRKLTLATLLDLASQLSSNDLNAWTFRRAAYTKTLLDNKSSWDCPPAFLPLRDEWALYERNEILSVLMQAVLSWSLERLQMEPQAFQTSKTVEEFSATLCQHIDALPEVTFASLRDRVSIQVPNVSDYYHDDHEEQIAGSLAGNQGAWRDSDTMPKVVSGLALLSYRMTGDNAVYGKRGMEPPEYVPYPIHLGTFITRSNSWLTLSVREVCKEVLMWVLQTHLLVAMRKLRQTGDSTFHLVQGEHGFEVSSGVPIPTWTNPRLTQLIQILRDLGVLNDPSIDGCALTEKGRRWHQELCHA